MQPCVMKRLDKGHFGEGFACRIHTSRINPEGFGRFCRKMSHIRSPNHKKDYRLETR